MKKHEPKFSLGSLYICSKCGRDFDAPENAENLKNSLRSELKNESKDHLKIRVMVSSCLGVCESGEQAIGYFPNQGPMELHTVNPIGEPKGHQEILDFVKVKLQSRPQDSDL